MQTDSSPFVAVIMPIRNEADFIEGNLNSVLNQDYPADHIKVIVAEGMSTDGTREKLAEFKKHYPQLQVIDNLEQNIPHGLNAALELTCKEQEIIIRIDGHSSVAGDFVRKNVALLSEHPEAWSVGGPIVHRGQTLFGKAAAVAMSHPIGVGNASHRHGNYEGYAEGAAFPAVWRWVFERIGKFDEQLVRNEDDEFNYRLRKAGGKVYISPQIRYTYYVRGQVSQLFLQYLQYGFWRVKVLKKHRRPAAWRQLVPALFYLTMVSLLGWGFLLKDMTAALGLSTLYIAALISAGLSVLPKSGLKIASLVPLAIAVMHAGYAWGFLYGALFSLFNSRLWNNNLRMAAISR